MSLRKEINVTSITLALNEEELIGELLEELTKYVDFSIVIDGYSTDNTYKIARKHADIVLRDKCYEDFSYLRNKGHRAVPPDHQWVLHVDCDERFNVEFLKNMKNIIEEHKVLSFRFPRQNAWYDQPLFEKDYQVRLVRTFIVWKRKVHEIPFHPIIPKPIDRISVETLDQYPIIHKPKDLGSYKLRQQRYENIAKYDDKLNNTLIFK